MRRKLMNMCLTALLSIASTTAWALTQVDGVYQIGTAEDLKAFAELVNGDNPYACAVLTADIDKGTDITQIGRDGQDFQGVFDGAGHTITYDMTFTANGAGLFRNVGVHAVIQNLKVQGTLNSNSSFAGAIAGWSSGRIRGCYVDVTINSSKSGDATDGGLIGIAYRGTVVENCLAKIQILGENTTNCGGVVGWANDKINVANCLVVSDGSTFKYTDASNGHSSNIARNEGNLNVVNVATYNDNPYSNRPAGANYNNYVTVDWTTCNATTVVPLAGLADGKVCYQLNNDQSKINWVQDIGTDPFPVPVAFGSIENQVFASVATNCSGKAEGKDAEEISFSNSGSVQATAHTFDKYGVCTTCGCFNFSGFEDYDITDASVLLKTANDIYLAEGWNRIGDGFKLNMKMANDIEITAPTGQLIFNNSNWVDGNFNGQGHALTYTISEVTENEASFIPQHTGIFENVILHGSISTANPYAGSISGRGRQTTVRNVFSDVTINTTRTGDNTTGGLFGIAYNGKSVENCIYAGDINGVDGTTCIAGFCGWADAATTFNNCAFLGTLNNAGGDSHTISRNPGNATGNNVYSLNEYNNTDAGKYVTTTPEAVESGELAFKLNGSEGGVERFYQVIGTDLMPMPFAKEGGLVYAFAAEYRCDGLPLGDDVTYKNSSEGIVIPDHEFEDGLCKNCGLIEADEEGFAKIINGQTLAAFANYVNAGNTGTKARMYADIDMTDVEYTPAGNQSNIFVGEFDGQGHTISNLTVNGGDYTGLIGVIGGGAVIKNFVLDNTCSINGNAFCGIVGGTNGGGNVYLTNLGNEGNVTGTAQNASGILGVDMGGSATLFIKNCYVTGAVKGARESAVICSWSNSASVVENCYSIASLEGKYGDEDSFTRGSASCVNCYEIEGVGTQNNKTGSNRTNIITAEEVASGALCIKLGEAFRQNLGEDAYPVLYQTHGIVKEIPEAGYATMYIGKAVDVPEGVTAYTGAVQKTWLALTAVEGAVPAWEPVVLKGDAGLYSFKPAAAVEQTVVVDFSAMGFENAEDLTEITVGGVTLSFDGGGNINTPKYYDYGSAARLYGSNSMTIAAADGITKIEFVFGSANKVDTPTSSEQFSSGDYDAETATWTGEANSVTLTRPAGAGHYRVEKIMVTYLGTPANIEGNELKGTAEDIEAAGKYVLAKPEGEQAGFYLAASGTIKAGKAYLEVADPAGIKAFYFDGNEATGIAGVENNTLNNDALIYNLAGQRIQKMQKGVNIVGGKKILK